MQIGRRIYYELATGNVIQDTGEREGSVIETTAADDFAAYIALSERVPSTVGCIQLEFGELAQDFAECNGYRVDAVTETIIFDSAEPIPVLDIAKHRKIAELSRICNDTILAGFASSALGSPHTYDFDEEAQRNLAGRLGILNAIPDYSSVFMWKTTDSGPLDHTKAQFVQVCNDADSFKDGEIGHYWTLKAQVNAAADVNGVNAIIW